ncbi:hypothetical protein SAMN05421858_1634 [Haladaptatus litoreus]|uniref:DUF7344 domain-containing protein n=1 Tax=Haladaptatus litoreus TaxID=553468 RepID=A0A1N6YMB6_9EURY|nr:hypothetical protein [Haladaptatus litoreus]SIR15697.1 hypothetical protein SAMN05421858_1634 [Haladaptatus litoreus]
MASLNTIFDLLSEKRRRYVLYYLEEQGESVPVDELVETVADWESSASGNDIPADKFREVEISLVHTDLPKTANVEFIEYDVNEKMVKINGTSPEFDTIINLAKIIEEPESEE